MKIKLTKEMVVKFLPLIMRFDKRLQCHTFRKVDGKWKHVDKTCPLCWANEMLELSTDKDLQ